MPKLSFIFKAAASVFVIGNYIVLATIAKFFLDDEYTRRHFFLKQVKKHSKILLCLLDIEVVVENKERIHHRKNYMMLGNHLSYLDPLLISSIEPTCFVTSMDMREVPVLGLLTEIGGCLYVNRKDKSNITKEIENITAGLQQGFHVAIFPEATSTNGSKVLPFKRSLLSAAVQAQKDILPFVIQYESIDGELVNSKNRDSLCWYGDMGFAPHFFGLMKKNCIRIRVSFLEEIPVDINSTRDQLVELAFAKISSHYKSIQNEEQHP